MTFADNILRSLTSSTNDKFDGALQILDVITQLVADRLGAGVCATLYCKSGDDTYSLLSIEDKVGIETGSLSLIETFVNKNIGNAQFFGRYLDYQNEPDIDSVNCDVILSKNLDLAYAHEFESENGDRAVIISFIEQSENTSVVSADRVCRLASQQLRVIFKFVEMAIHERSLKSFMGVVLKLSSLSFVGATVDQTLTQVGALATGLIGVGTAKPLNREDDPEGFDREIAGILTTEQSVDSVSRDGFVDDQSTNNLGSLAPDENNVPLSLLDGLTFEGAYITTLEACDNPRWALKFTPPPFGGFGEQELELLRLFASYSAITLSNHNLAHRQKRVNDDLRAAQDRLVEAESLAAIGDMASGLAHDFNNLIGSVIGKIEVLKTKFAIPELVVELEEIENLSAEGAERMRRLQEFALSAKSTNLATIDLVGFYKEFESEIRPWREAAGNKSVDVSFLKSNVSSAMISGKPSDIGLMIDNLLLNAIEATTANGGVTVSLTTDKGRARISVCDGGSGVPDNIKHKIFNPFFTTKTGTRGAGLGLSVAHGIAVRHGGSISVGSSNDSVGSTFTAAFPIVDARVISVPPKEEPKEAKKLMIMVVDDDPQIRDVISDMLKLVDQESESYEDAETALSGFEKDKFDLIITDLGMPGLSGLELTGLLKKQEPDLPIAMVTGWGAQLNEEDILAQGIFKLIAKPFYLKDIKGLIQTASEMKS